MIRPFSASAVAICLLTSLPAFAQTFSLSDNPKVSGFLILAGIFVFFVGSFFLMEHFGTSRKK